MPTRAEKRRSRRGRQPSVQRGQGHGQRRYVGVRESMRPTFMQRQAAREARMAKRKQSAKAARLFEMLFRAGR